MRLIWLNNYKLHRLHLYCLFSHFWSLMELVHIPIHLWKSMQNNLLNSLLLCSMEEGKSLKWGWVNDGQAKTLKVLLCVWDASGLRSLLGAGRFSRDFSEMLTSLFSTLMLCVLHPNVTSDTIDFCVFVHRPLTCVCSVHFKRARVNISMESPDTWNSFKWCQLISVSPWRVNPPTSQKWTSSSQSSENDAVWEVWIRFGTLESAHL